MPDTGENGGGANFDLSTANAQIMGLDRPDFVAQMATGALSLAVQATAGVAYATLTASYGVVSQGLLGVAAGWSAGWVGDLFAGGMNPDIVANLGGMINLDSNQINGPDPAIGGYW